MYLSAPPTIGEPDKWLITCNISSPSLTSNYLAFDTVLLPSDSLLSPLSNLPDSDDEGFDAFENDTDNLPNN